MGRVIDRIKKRRAAQKPQQQYYGGSKEAYAEAQGRNQAGIDAGTARADEGLGRLDVERMIAGGRSAQLYDQAGRTAAEQAGQAGTYGAGADASVSDYRGGREALLGSAGAIDANAGRMEQLAANAPQQYQSSADAAYRAATERNQRSALALAAGRGGGSVRQALASSQAGNQQAALDQQVVRAQEANALLGLQGNLLQGAAGVRGQGAGVRAGVSGQDLQSAQLQAGRQQGATAANMQGQAAQQAIGVADAALGANAAGARIAAGTGTRDAYLGSQNSMEIAQLGGNQAYELQRQANAKQNNPFQKAGSWIADPMNFRGAEAGKVM